MSWNRGITLEIAQRIFCVAGWNIYESEEEGCYVAENGDVVYRNTVLTQLCIRLVKNHMTSKE